MHMRTLQIGLTIIFIALLIAIFKPLPRESVATRLFIHDKNLNFMWLLPNGWLQVEPLTGADYALNFRNDKAVSLVLDTWEESHNDAHSLTEKLRANPSFLFEGAIKPRFPDSRFLGSSVEDVNSHPAIQSSFEFTTFLENQRIVWFGCQVVTIHNNMAYNFVVECPWEKRDYVWGLMREAVHKFLFLEGDHFTYTGFFGRSYEGDVPTKPTKESLGEIDQILDAYFISRGQDMIPALLNSFIQGIVLPFAEVPEAVADYLDSPHQIWDWGGRELLTGTEFNFPVSGEHQRSVTVRTAKYVPSVTYVALIFLLIYTKRKKAKSDQGMQKIQT